MNFERYLLNFISLSELKEKVKKEAALSFEEWADRHKKNIDSFYE